MMSTNSNRLLSPIGKPFLVRARKHFPVAVGFAVNMQNDAKKSLSISGYSQPFWNRIHGTDDQPGLVETDLLQVGVQLFTVTPPPDPPDDLDMYASRSIDVDLKKELRLPFVSCYAFLMACKRRFTYVDESRRYKSLTGFIADSSDTYYVADATCQPCDNRFRLSERPFGSMFLDNLTNGNEFIAPAQKLVVV